MRTNSWQKGLTLLLPIFLCALPDTRARAQGGTPPDTSIARGITAGEADADMERRNLLSALHLKLGFTTLRIGAGVLVDYIGYDQDSASREQFPNLPSQGKLRDARILFGGTFNTKRPFTWQIGVMYDAAQKNWLFRQTGFMHPIRWILRESERLGL